MLRNFVLLVSAVIISLTVVEAVPFKSSDDSPPHMGWGGHGGGWGWGSERPAYDINPHFGFRQYSEMRYEPLTAPYVYSTQLNGAPAPPQPLAPLFTGQGPPHSPYLPGPIKSVGILEAAHNAYLNPSPPPYSGSSNSLYSGGNDGYST